MHSITPSSSAKKPFVDLAANHKSHAAWEETRSIEGELKETTKKIHELNLTKQMTDNLNDLEEKIKKAQEEWLKDLQHLKKAADRLVKQTAASRHTVDPKQSLYYIKSSPSYDDSHRMDPDEEEKFMSIEEALSNPRIIKAMPTQVNHYQLGAIWNAYKEERLSPKLFYHLTFIRAPDASPEFHLFEKNGALYKSNHLQICQSIHESLYNEDENYTISVEEFNKRLNGINNEMIEERLKKLKKDSFKTSISPTRPPSEVDQQLLMAPEAPTFSPYLAEAAEANIESKKTYYPLRDSVKKWIKECIPPHKKDKIDLNVSFDKIMQASLSKMPERGDHLWNHTPNERIDDYFVARLAKISNQASHQMSERVSENISTDSVPMDAISKIKTLIEEYEKKRQRPKDCRLDGEKLIDEYFKRLDRVIDKKLNSKAQEIAKSKNQKKLTKAREQLNLTYKNDLQEIKEFKKFLIENSDKWIFVNLE